MCAFTVASISTNARSFPVTTHKEEKPARIKSDAVNREKIHEKLNQCLDPLDPTDHPEGITNIVTGFIAPDSVNVNKTVDIGKSLLSTFSLHCQMGFIVQLAKE